MNLDLFLRQTAAAIPTAGNQKQSTLISLFFALALPKTLLTDVATNIEKVRGALSFNSLLRPSIENFSILTLLGLLRQFEFFFEHRPLHSRSIYFKINNCNCFFSWCCLYTFPVEAFPQRLKVSWQLSFCFFTGPFNFNGNFGGITIFYSQLSG